MRVLERIISVGGTDVFVRDVGEGSPVVLVNGIGASVSTWTALEESLEGFRVISFDAPGTGRSRTGVLPRRMAGLSRLLLQLFDKLDLARADVLGYSFGGGLAQHFAATAPSRVRRLVLAATFPGWGGVPGTLPALLSMSIPLRYYSRWYYDKTTPLISGARSERDTALRRRLWDERKAHPPDPLGYLYQLLAVSTFTSLRLLDQIEAPTLIVGGDDDPLVPISNALIMASRIQHARVHVAPGEGHLQLLDRASDSLAVVRGFLRATDLDHAAVWESARRIARPDAIQQLQADGPGALPWGAVSALVRLAAW